MNDGAQAAPEAPQAISSFSCCAHGTPPCSRPSLDHVGRLGLSRSSLLSQELVKSLDLGDYVHFLGFVPEDDLPALYRHSDIFAIASDVEVQSIPTLQAAATGLPIMAADAAALPELVQDSMNGHLVRPDDPTALAAAIGNILDDPELAERLGQESLEVGRRHAEKETFDAYENLYEAYSQKVPA